MIEMSLQQSESVALPHRSPGRQLRSVAVYSLLAAAMILTPAMLVFVPAVLFHCAIRNGKVGAWTAASIAIAIGAAYVIAVPGPANLRNMAWSSLAGVSLSVVLPSLLVLPLVERAEKFGRVLVALLMSSAVGLALTELGSRAILAFSPFVAQVAEVQRSNAQFVQFYRTNGVTPENLRMIERWASYNTVVLPAFLLIMLTFVFILSLLMLGRLKAWRELAAARGDNEAFGAYLFRNLSLPDWVLFAFIIGGLTPLASGMLQTITVNTLAVVAFLYMLQGLAIFRFLLVAMGASLSGMVLGWLLLVFLTLTGVGPFLLALAGLFDPFFDFRHFKKRKDDSHESHSD